MPGRTPQKTSKREHFIAKYGTWILLGVIVLVAIFFRFYKLDTLPPGLFADEAANGVDIVHRIFQGNLQPLYNTNGPRESLFFFIQAIFVKLIGNTVLALRIAPALMGVAGVIALYYWATDWFGRRVGLFAAFFMAVNPWVVVISRDGFRASMTPLLVATVAYFGGKAFKTKQVKHFVFTGIALGLGAYTYTAYQLMLAAVLGLTGYLLIFRRDWIKGQAKNFGIGLITFLIVLAPLGFYAVKHPESFARASGTSVLNPDLNHGKPLETLLDSAQKTLLQYNFVGDSNPRHNVPGEPHLNTFVGIMFVLGILICLFTLHKSKYFAVLAITLSMMLPSILTAEGLPHGLRSIGSAPGVLLLAAIGLSYFLGRWYTIFPINSIARNVGLSFVIVLLLATGVQGYKAYFVAWGGNPDTYRAYDENTVELSKFINGNLSGANAPKVYIVMDEYPSFTVDYLTYEKATWERVTWDRVDSLPLTDKPTVFLFRKGDRDKEIIETLKTKYPSATVNAKNSPVFTDDTLYYDVEVNR